MVETRLPAGVSTIESSTDALHPWRSPHFFSYKQPFSHPAGQSTAGAEHVQRRARLRAGLLCEQTCPVSCFLYMSVLFLKFALAGCLLNHLEQQHEVWSLFHSSRIVPVEIIIFSSDSSSRSLFFLSVLQTAIPSQLACKVDLDTAR